MLLSFCGGLERLLLLFGDVSPEPAGDLSVVESCGDRWKCMRGRRQSRRSNIAKV
jgi:hypothetical protein